MRPPGRQRRPASEVEDGEHLLLRVIARRGLPRGSCQQHLQQHRPLPDAVDADLLQPAGQEVGTVADGVHVVVVAVLERGPHRDALRPTETHLGRQRRRGEPGRQHRDVVVQPLTVRQHGVVGHDPVGGGPGAYVDPPPPQQRRQAPAGTGGEGRGQRRSRLEQSHQADVGADRQVAGQFHAAGTAADDRHHVPARARGVPEQVAQPGELSQRLDPHHGAVRGRPGDLPRDAADVERDDVPVVSRAGVGADGACGQVDIGGQALVVVDAPSGERGDVEPAGGGIVAAGSDGRSGPAVVEPPRGEHGHAVSGRAELVCLADQVQVGVTTAHEQQTPSGHGGPATSVGHRLRCPARGGPRDARAGPGRPRWRRSTGRRSTSGRRG